MLRRFTLFFFGVFLGTLLVYFLLIKNRDDRELFAWLPENRKRAEIAALPIKETKTFICKKECYELSTQTITNLLKKADVVFSKSLAQSKPPSYLLDIETLHLGKIGVIIQINKDTAVYQDLICEIKTCACD